MAWILLHRAKGLVRQLTLNLFAAGCESASRTPGGRSASSSSLQRGLLRSLGLACSNSLSSFPDSASASIWRSHRIAHRIGNQAICKAPEFILREALQSPLRFPLPCSWPKTTVSSQAFQLSTAQPHNSHPQPVHETDRTPHPPILPRLLPEPRRRRLAQDRRLRRRQPRPALQPVPQARHPRIRPGQPARTRASAASAPSSSSTAHGSIDQRRNTASPTLRRKNGQYDRARPTKANRRDKTAKLDAK